MKESNPLFNFWNPTEKNRLGLENIYSKCFPGQSYNGITLHINTYVHLTLIYSLAYRVMEDVKAMKAIFPAI